jgi:DNA-binding response OmpR family regulator
VKVFLSFRSVCVAQNLAHYFGRMGWSVAAEGVSPEEQDVYVCDVAHQDVGDAQHRLILRDVPRHMGDIHVALERLVTQLTTHAKHVIQLEQGWSLNITQHQLMHAQLTAPIDLTEREADLLLYLFLHKEGSVNKEQILSHVWKYHADADTHTVETHMYRLRQKLLQPDVSLEILYQQEGYQLSFAR